MRSWRTDALFTWYHGEQARIVSDPIEWIIRKIQRDEYRLYELVNVKTPSLVVLESLDYEILMQRAEREAIRQGL